MLIMYFISVKSLRMLHFTLLIHSHSRSLLKFVFLCLVLLDRFFMRAGKKASCKPFSDLNGDCFYRSDSESRALKYFLPH